MDSNQRHHVGHRRDNTVLALVAGVAVVAASCLTLFANALLKRNSKPTQKQGKGREGGSARKSPGAGAYFRGMREREYVSLIPDVEMLSLQSLLRRIQKARGWQFRDDAARDQAWARVLATAQSAAGGAWPLDFTPNDVTPEQLQALCDAVEAEFLGGLLAEQVRRAGRPRIRVVLGVDPRDPYSWLSGLHEDNTIFVNSNRWREEVSQDNPLVFEGALCRSKLEALAHTLGHELTHAVVLNFFPAMDASSPAYTPDDKHGPVFMWLNRRLFGHVGHASKRLFNT